MGWGENPPLRNPKMTKLVDVKVKGGFPLCVEYRDYATAAWIEPTLSDQDWTDIETACHEHSADCFNEDW